MKNLSSIDWIALVLMIIGGLNLGLVGFFSYDLIASVFGDMSGLTRVIDGLVGLGALYMLFTLKKIARK